MSRRKRYVQPTPSDDGWSQAGLQVAAMLARRPEVKSKGIIGAVQDILTALDAKPKVRSESYWELLAQLKNAEDRTVKYKRQREQVIGLFLLVVEDSSLSSKVALARVVNLVKAGLGERILEKCRKEARALIAEDTE